MPDAERDAQQILERVWTTGPDPSDTRLPVDPFYIAKRLGLGVFIDPTLKQDVSGMLTKRQGYDDPEILLNANDSRNRQRFTCAHELGHYSKRSLAGDQGEWRYVDHRDTLATTGRNPDEIYANQFAAALLMPASLVKMLSQTYGVPSLAYQFGVSADAMNFRLTNLGLR